MLMWWKWKWTLATGWTGKPAQRLHTNGGWAGRNPIAQHVPKNGADFLSVCVGECAARFCALLGGQHQTAPEWINRSEILALIGCRLENLEAGVERRSVKELLSIRDNPDHALHHINISLILSSLISNFLVINVHDSVLRGFGFKLI